VIRAALLAAILVAACDCDRSGESLSLPATDAAARSILEGASTRAPVAAAPLDASRIAIAIREGIERDSIVIGEPAIAHELDSMEADFLLFGVWHDSGAQIEIVRRVTSMLSEAPADFAVELVEAPQLYEGFETSREAALLSDYLFSGSQASLEGLRAELETRNYTAWKYGYVAEILDLAIDARAGGRRMIGCDVTRDVMRAIERFEPDTRLRFRELHCARTIASRLRESERMVLIYGDAHVSGEGLPRFLPEAASVGIVHVIGGRIGEAGVEPELGRSIGITEPILVSLGAELALVIPDRHLGVPIDRRRESASGDPGVLVSSDRPVELVLAGRTRSLGESPLALPLEPGSHAAAFRTRERLLVFRVEVDASTTEIDLVGDEIRTLFR
jgi:hypothetical protein